MAKRALYGITSIKFMTPAANGAFADFATLVEGTNGLTIHAIVRDSFTFSDTTPSTTDLDVEDMDLHYATLNSDEGTKQFTFQSYDMSDTAVKFLLGYIEDSNNWIQAPATSPTLYFAIQVQTRQLQDIPSTIMQWARCKVEITKSGTLGKSGLPNFNFTCTEVVNLDANGAALPNYRYKFVEENNG